MTPKSSARPDMLRSTDADYMKRSEFPVLSRSSPARSETDCLHLRKSASHGGRSRRSRRGDPPGITHWQSPASCLFPANSSGPAVLGDLLSSGPARRDALTSPAATELETHVLDWLSTCAASRRSSSRSAAVVVIHDSACRPLRRPARRASATHGQANRHGPAATSPSTPPSTAIPPSTRRSDRRLRPSASATWRYARPADGPRRLGGGDHRRRGGGLHSGGGGGHHRHHVVDRHRPSQRSPRSPRTTASAPRRRRLRGTAAVCRRCGGSSTGWTEPTRTCSTPQVMLTNFDCSAFLRRRPGPPDRHPLDPARVPAQQGDGIGGGHRLPGLADPRRRFRR